MTTVAASNPWLPYNKGEAKAGLRLFCLPFAGGAASIFRSWQPALGAEIEVAPIELPGRGTRFREKAVPDLLPLARAVAEGISSHLDRPYLFFGHSMGALLGYEVVRHLRRTHGMEPLIFFAAGRNGAHIPEPKISYDLPDQQLLERLQELNGTPQGLMEHPEFKMLMLPTLRADFAISETYTYTDEAPFRCPIVALGGIADPETTIEELDAWRQHTSSSFKLRLFPGEHFFLNTAKDLMLETMMEEVRAVQGSKSMQGVG